jgi:predicted pyridoxine 5'-phosphate oxidase superfamily flavin-nucleotide-binding protein
MPNREKRMNQSVSRVDELREVLGGVHPGAATKVKDHLEPYVQAFIENAPFAVLSSCDSDGNCDASPKGGLPGFIKVLNERTLLIPDIGGNRLFQTYQNFESNPKAGLLFLIPGMDVTARVNGRVRLLEPDALEERGIEPELAWSDDNSGLIQGIVLDIDEAYFHCPRSFQFASLWDTEIIETNRERSIKSLKAD